MLLCVGTAMGVADYDLISEQIIKASPDIIVILLDPNPYWPFKLDSIKFARLVEATREQLPNFFPTYSFHDSRIIIGGHSAGGKAAIGALSLLSFTPVGYFGLDPFPVDSSHIINIPTMIWYVHSYTSRYLLESYRSCTNMIVLLITKGILNNHVLG
jgi:hypothetical protein